MRRTFIFAAMLLLAAFTAAQAQETQSTQIGSTGTVTTDPLTLPTSTIPLTGGLATESLSVNGTNAPSSFNSQTALQLPGETANTTTQSPSTTASRPAAASAAGASAGASGTLCSSSVSTTTGELSAGSLTGGISIGGC